MLGKVIARGNLREIYDPSFVNMWYFNYNIPDASSTIFINYGADILRFIKYFLIIHLDNGVETRLWKIIQLYLQ